ncbi:hypothetical protein [Chitinophaga sp. CF418]|uniref:hypothetical protein n=1 Tax=Chitinophaga sp. CF418 TaxID=1855287 RepID=UPI0009192072|nr:hypothetical protein [Chitinophaga sp. CF418]SHN33702.1 hypothetical protein SAMN05216311_109198 [Chitinophaga sp. CF418]
MKNDEVRQGTGLAEETSSADQRLAVGLDTASLDLCSITVTYVDGETVVAAYSGLPGNQPATYKNFVAIWENSVIPWTAQPLAMVPIAQNSQQGSVTFNGLTITRAAYIVGYAVGPEISNICCSSLIAAGGLLAAPTQVSISLNYVGADMLSIHYQTLAGYLPQQYNNWIGLWKGYASPYNADTPLATVIINSNASEGTANMPNIQLEVNTNYTLIYFMGKERTMAAAILNFNTADFLAGI